MPKPGGKWRLVIDYRYLNSQIDDEQFPLPVIDDMFLKQSKNAIWSIFDLEDGFHQMHLDEASRPLTAFVTPWGLFQWTVLPMGLKTAPQMCQRMVSDCLSSLGLEPYIDNLLLGTPDTEDNPDLDALVTDSCLRQHESELRRFLQRMDDCDLTIKPSKMLLFVQRVHFCGQILCRGRRCPDPEKTASVQRWRWQDIHTPTQLKAFLGFAQWYALYIDRFADLAAPLTDALRGLDLTKKGKSKSAHPPLSARAKRELQDRLRQQHPGLFAAQRECLLRQHVCQRENRIHWSDHMVRCFEQLKKSLCQDAMLHLPDTTRQFWIRCDSSEYAVGGVLEQKGCSCTEADCSCPLRPVAFFSRKLQGTPGKGQRAWHIRDKETYAIVATLFKFRSWLQSAQVNLRYPVTVLTDHRSLESWTREDVDTVSGPIGRRGRWHQFLARFKIEVVYTKGENQEVPDVLSRSAYPAMQYAPDVSLHGSEQDQRGWDNNDQEVRQWADQLAELRSVCVNVRSIFSDWWAKQPSLQGCPDSWRHVSDCVCMSPCLQDSISAVEEDDVQFSLAERRLRQVYSTSSPLSRSLRNKKFRTVRRNIRQQNWSPAAMVAAMQCAPGANVAEGADGVSDLTWASVRANTVPPDVSVLFADWEPEYRQDPEWQGILASLQQDDPHLRAPGCCIYRPSPGTLRIRRDGKDVVPRSLITKVIAACHTYIHGGADKTYHICRRRFSFSGLTDRQLWLEVKSFCDSCEVCQQTKPRTGIQPGEVEFYPVPDEIFSSLAIDFVDLPKTKVNDVVFDYAMVVVCRFTGYVLAIPTTKLGMDSRKAATLSLERVVFFMGLPKEVFSDNASVINSDFLNDLFDLSGIEHHTSVVYKPSTNGRAEAAVKSLVMALRKFLNQRPRSWYHALPLALWGLNDLPGLVAPYSPHRLAFGRDPVGFGECPPIVPGEGAQEAQDFFDRLASERKQVHDHLVKLHHDASAKLTAKFRDIPFREGDRVWVRDLPRKDQPNFNKLKRIWEGPYEILRWMGGGRYLVQTNSGPTGQQVLQRERLKYYRSPDPKTKVPLSYYSDRQLPPSDDTYNEAVPRTPWLG